MLSFQQSSIHWKNRAQLQEKRTALLILLGEAAFILAAVALYMFQ